MRTATTIFDPILRLRHEIDRYAVFVATAAFTLVTAAQQTGDLELPGGQALLFAYPLGLLAIDRLRPGNLVERELRGAAAWSFVLLAAFWLIPYAMAFKVVAAAAPFAIAGAIMVARFPAAATVALPLMTAFQGTAQAHLGFLPLSLLTDGILAALWLVLIGRVVLGRPHELAVWPAIAGCGLYFALSAVDLLLAGEFGVAWIGFHTTVWLMLALVLLPYAGWERTTYRRMAIGIVVVAAIVSAYAVFRWIVGPSGAEEALARVSGGQINVDPIDKTLRTVGSFLTAHQLAFWTGLMGPFCLAMSLLGGRTTRILALAAFALTVAAIVASDARGPVGGLVAGSALVLTLYAFSRAFPGFKGGLLALGLIGIAGVSAGIIALGESDPERLDRYSGILNPGDDPTWVQRERKWENIFLPAIAEEPFGHGLGTGGQGAAQSETLQAASVNIDNSYLKIAYEQGMFVMAVYVVAFGGLLISMVVAVLRTTSREAAVIGAGACGTLASMLVSFYTGLYIETGVALGGWVVVGLGLAWLIPRQPGRDAAVAG